MSTLLVKHADLLVTMDAGRRRIPDGGLFVRDNVVEQAGPTAELPAEADRVINASGMIVLPGLVNTHHHLYQTLTRAVPAAQDATLFRWLKTLYPVWARMTPEAIYTSALVGLAELVLSGCTTTSDHLYIYPNGCRIDDEIRAAQEIGIRFQPCRGAMSLGESDGGLPPDSVVENESFILQDTQRGSETTDRNDEYLANVKHVGISNAVGDHQILDRDIVSLSNDPQCVPRLNSIHQLGRWWSGSGGSWRVWCARRLLSGQGRRHEGGSGGLLNTIPQEQDSQHHRCRDDDVDCDDDSPGACAHVLGDLSA